MSSSSSSPLKQRVRLACIQLASGPSKAANLLHAAQQVQLAARSGAQIVVLPECFNSPYGTSYFADYAEPIPSPTSVSVSTSTSNLDDDLDGLDESAAASPSVSALSRMARDNKIYLIGGSIPERCPSTKSLYNTSLVFSPSGALLASHRKTHLFDINIPDRISFRESDVLSPGNKLTLVHLPEYGTIAVAICYDVRFPELATIAARRGAFALVYPGAFNLTTGPLHWKLLAQARALDNQIYVAMCSPARDLGATYHAYGHSMIVDPMASVLVEAEEGETIVHADLDGDAIDVARRNIPLNDQRRFDVYPDVSVGKVSFEEPTS